MNVKAYRQARNLTQAQLGHIVGRSRSTIAAWEAGTSAPDIAAVRLMERIRDLNASELRSLGREGPEISQGAERFADWLKKGADIEFKTLGTGDNERIFRSVTGNSDRFELEALRSLSTGANPHLVGFADMPVESPLQLPTGLGALGARYIPTDQPLRDAMIPLLVSDPPVEWLGEGDGHSGTGDPGTAQLRPDWKTACALTKATRRLAKMAVTDGAAALAAAALRALGRALDTAAIVGDGVNEPEGLLAVAGTQVIDATAGFDAGTYDSAMKLLADAGVESANVGAAANQSVRETLSGVTYDNRNLWSYRDGGENVAGRPALCLPAMPAGTLLLGGFDQLALIHQRESDMNMVPTPNDDRIVYSWLECSAVALRPAAFVKVINIA